MSDSKPLLAFGFGLLAHLRAPSVGGRADARAFCVAVLQLLLQAMHRVLLAL
jgi:hypothetical protein